MKNLMLVVLVFVLLAGRCGCDRGAQAQVFPGGELRRTVTLLVWDSGAQQGRPYYNSNGGQLAVVVPVYLVGENQLVDMELQRLARVKATVELEFNLTVQPSPNLRSVRRVTAK